MLTDQEIIFARTMAERQWDVADTAMLILLARVNTMPLSGIVNTYMALVNATEAIADHLRHFDGKQND